MDWKDYTQIHEGACNFVEDNLLRENSKVFTLRAELYKEERSLTVQESLDLVPVQDYVDLVHS